MNWLRKQLQKFLGLDEVNLKELHLLSSEVAEERDRVVDTINKITDRHQLKLGKEADAIKRDLEFWHKQFRSYHFTTCRHCKKKMMTWPYEREAYYTLKDGGYVHSDCYGKFLERDV